MSMFKKPKPVEIKKMTYEEVYYQDVELYNAVSPHIADGDTIEFQIGNRYYIIEKGVQYE